MYNKTKHKHQSHPSNGAPTTNSKVATNHAFSSIDVLTSIDQNELVANTTPPRYFFRDAGRDRSKQARRHARLLPYSSIVHQSISLTDSTMPIASQRMDSTPKIRRTRDPRHSTQDLRQLGRDCAQAHVATNLRIVLQHTGRQGGNRQARQRMLNKKRRFGDATNGVLLPPHLRLFKRGAVET